MENDGIHIINARTNNLKSVTLTIPRNNLTVITGVSGSGKSSLAFETLYAEGQRRYVESLSAYARQFLGRMKKPDVDKITGLPPAIAIEQHTASNNVRSTVGTTTEIYFYLKLLFARCGKTFSPISGQEVHKHTVTDVIESIKQQPIGTKVMLLCPIVLKGRTFSEQLHAWEIEGFSRLLQLSTKQVVNFSEATDNVDDYTLLIDRIVTNGEQSTLNRCIDSVQTAFYEGQGRCMLLLNGIDLRMFSTHYEADGIHFLEPTEHLFDFNNPLGACPTCKGLGIIEGIDEDLVIPDKSKSLYEQAIACWRSDTFQSWNQDVLTNAPQYGIPIHTPYYQLTDEQKRLLWTGTNTFQGLNQFFEHLKAEHKIQNQFLLSRYQGKTQCPDCHGTRLRPEAGYVLVNGTNIQTLSGKTVEELLQWLQSWDIPADIQAVAVPIVKELTNRLQCMQDVGLSYLTLDRLTGTLSGGETQRINLAKSLGSSLVGALYVLDEPSIGLHPVDTERLISVLKKLRDLGNTIVVVEHDEEIIATADYIVEIGPAAGTHGGEIVYAGLPKPSLYHYTFPTQRPLTANYIELRNACEHNLQNLTIRIPLNAFTVITGVSGSGKSTLIGKVLYPTLQHYFDGEKIPFLSGSMHLLQDVEYINQKPLSKSTRSNPVTYLKAFDDIRELFALQPLAVQQGFTPVQFSFNTPGGRCEECQGAGTITIEMQFMADLVLECEQCHGKRYKKDILEVEFDGKNIYDILELTVDDALDFFGRKREQPKDWTLLCQRIVRRLQPLHDVGIGYVKLGQASSTLSGGEAQRVKLASFLADQSDKPTLFIFDEPTTGLHHNDITTLLNTFDRLIQHGHTIVVIEHNPQVILHADYVIDLGPGGGVHGGQVVFQGTITQLLQCPQSVTGHCIQTLIAQ